VEITGVFISPDRTELAYTMDHDGGGDPGLYVWRPLDGAETELTEIDSSWIPLGGGR
jgi:hypothetical protein